MATKKTTSQNIDPVTGLEVPEIVLPDLSQGLQKAYNQLPAIKEASSDRSVLGDVRNLMSIKYQIDRMRNQAKKNAIVAPPSLPSWEELKIQMEGYDNLPYSEQSRLYNEYIEGAKKAFMAWNETLPKDKRLDEIDVDAQLREINKAPVKPSRTWGEAVEDVARGVAAGAVSVPAMIGTVSDTIAGTPQESSKYFEDIMKDLREGQSAVEKDVQKQIAFETQKLYNDPDKTWLGKTLGEMGIAVRNMSVGQVSELVGNMLPTILVSGGIGLATRGIATRALKMTAEQAAKATAGVSLASGTTLGAVLSGGDAAQQARDIVLNMSAKEIKALPGGEELWKKHKGNLKAVKDELATSSARTALAIGGTIGAVMSVVPGSLERTISRAAAGELGANVAGGLARRGTGYLANTATGALLGGLEEAGTTVAGQYGGRSIGADVNLTEGAGSSFVQGLIGEGLGAVGGVAAGRRLGNAAANAESAQINAQNVLAQAISKTANSNQPVTQTASRESESVTDAMRQAAEALNALNAGQQVQAAAVQQAAQQQAAQQQAVQQAAQQQAAQQQAAQQQAAQQQAAQQQAAQQQAAQQQAAQQQAAQQQAAQQQADTERIVAYVAQQNLQSNPIYQAASPVQRTAMAAALTASEQPVQTQRQIERYYAQVLADSINPNLTGGTPLFIAPDGNLLMTDGQSVQWTDAQGNTAANQIELTAQYAPQIMRQLGDPEGGNIGSAISDVPIDAYRQTDAAVNQVGTSSFGATTDIQSPVSWANEARRQGATAESVLAAVANDPMAGQAFRRAASELHEAVTSATGAVPAVKYTGQTVQHTQRGQSGFIGGEYRPERHTIELNNGATVSHVMHEALHSLTYQGLIDMERRARLGDKNARDSWALIHWLIDKVNNERGKTYLYATENAGEIFSELANPAFIAMAQRIPLGKVETTFEHNGITGDPSAALNRLGLVKQRPTVWDAIVRFVTELANATAGRNVLSEQTVLDALTMAVGDVVSNRERSGTRTQQQAAQSQQQEQPSTSVLVPVEDAPRFVQTAKPMFGRDEVRFENALDKAAYIVANQKTKSRRHDDYMKFIRDHTGMTDEQIYEYGRQIRQVLNSTPAQNGVIYLPYGTGKLFAWSPSRQANASVNSTAGSQLDIENANANDQGLVSSRATVQDVIGQIEANEAAPAATVGRGLMQALQSRNVAGVKGALARGVEALNVMLHDSLVPVKRWFESVGAQRESLEKLSQDCIDAMYAAPNRRTQYSKIIYDNGGDRLHKAMAEVSRATKLTEETVMRYAGLWASANWSKEANARLLNRDVREISDLQKRLAKDPMDAEAQQELSEATNVFRKRYEAVQNADIAFEPDVGLAGGMTYAQADAIMAASENAIGADNIKKVTNALYDMNAMRLVLDIETGKVTPQAAVSFLNRPDLLDAFKTLRSSADLTTYDQTALNALRDQLKADVRTEYVPLTGDPLSALEEDTVPSGTRAPNVAADRRLKGRVSLADDGITASIGSVLRTASFAGWRPFQASIARLYNGMTPAERQDAGIARNTLKSFEATPRGSIVYRGEDGSAYAYYIDNDLLDTIRKTNVEQAGTVLSAISKPTQWFAYTCTQLNPTFAPINWFRDVWERSDNLSVRNLVDEQGNAVDAKKVSRSMWRYAFSPQTWKAALRYATNQKNDGSAASVAMQELAESGGISTRADYFSPNRSRFIQNITKSKGVIRNAASSIARVVDAYNRTFDLVPVLSSYMAMKDAGVQTNRASAETLDLMNFGKTGTAMPFVKGIYAFAQPTITGAANMLNVLYDRKTGRIRWKTGVPRLAAYALVLAAIQATARAVAGDDKTGNKMLGLTHYVLNNTVPFPMGDGVITIPLGFGLPKLANSMALNMLNLATKEITPTEAFGGVISDALVPAVSPIEPVGIDFTKRPAEAFMLMFSPTWLRPVVSVAVNRTSYDAPVINTQWEKTDQFRSEQFGTNVPDFYKQIAIEIRKTFGVDLAPEQVRIMLQGYMTGIPGMVLSGFIDDPFKKEQGKTVTNPVARRFFRDFTTDGAKAQFYNAQEEIMTLRRRVSAGEREDLTEEQQELLRLGDQWDKINSEFKSRVSKVSKNKTLSEEEKVKRRKEIYKQKEPYMFDFVRRYRMIVGKPTGD
jgi:hypothetical protein